MLQIILCDDDKFVLQLEAEQLRQEIDESKIDARIACMGTSASEIFGFLEKTTDLKALRRGYHRYLAMALKISQITYVETEKTVSHAITYHTVDASSITVRDTLEHAGRIYNTLVR